MVLMEKKPYLFILFYFAHSLISSISKRHHLSVSPNDKLILVNNTDIYGINKNKIAW